MTPDRHGPPAADPGTDEAPFEPDTMSGDLPLEEPAAGYPALVDVAEAAEDRLHRAGGFELEPIVRAAQPLAQATVTDDPLALEKIKVARAAGPRGAYVVRNVEKRH